MTNIGVSPIDRSIAKYSRSDANLRKNVTNRLLADIRGLAPDIATRAAEIEAGRRIPLDLVEALRSSGVFRMFAPQSHGGLELDLPSGLEIIAALGRIDGSVGWSAMIGSAGGVFAPSLPRQTYERVYRNGPDLIFAGSVQPAGTAEATSGGLRVNGRWPFASGCQHADWIAGFCVMTEGGKPLLGEGGRPLVRGVFLPAGDWQIEDTWSAMGLKGTGSHHITLKNIVRACPGRFIKPYRSFCRYSTAPLTWVWPRAPWTISSRLPTAGGSSSAPPCRFASRKYSSSSSAVSQPI